MTPMVVMSGGGIKGAAAAGRYAKDHDLVLLHVNYGQVSATREISALESLAPTFPRAKVLRIALPHFIQLQRSPTETTAQPGSRARPPTGGTEPASGVSPAVLRGLMPMVLSVGVQGALRVGSPTVAIGLMRSCDATHLGLPGLESAADQRREFLHAFNIMLETALRPRAPVRLEAPLMDLTYAEVIQLAVRFRVPLEKTWTCDGIGPQACGQCDPCKARSQAFAAAALVDPAATTVAAAQAKGPGIVTTSRSPGTPR